MKSQHSLLITFLLSISIHLFSTIIGNAQDENVLRSFDIKFGENEDKGLVNQYHRYRNELKYASDHLILGWASDELSLDKPIKLGRGFECTIYISNNIKDTKTDLNSVNIGFSQVQGSFDSFFSILIFKDSNRYALNDQISKQKTYFFPKNMPNIFDGEYHKIQFRYEFDLRYTKVKRVLWVDDIKAIDLSDSVSDTFLRGSLNTKFSLPVCPIFKSDINQLGNYENKTYIYRWSFKSL